MENDIYSFALKETLNEIRNICPDVKNTFIFRENGEIVAEDKDIEEKTITQVLNSFNGVLEKAESIGNINKVMVECTKGRVEISHINEDFYLVTVTSGKADVKYVSTVTHVLVPTVLKILEKIHPTPLNNQEEPTVTIEEEEIKENQGQPEIPASDELTSRLIVEHLGGLLAPSDTVRIDEETISKWENLCGEKIETVIVEAFNGKTVTCKVKPIKDSKYKGKGMIQVPKAIQRTLEIGKGELVKVKPSIK